jgi:hypothetical protein
VRIALRHYASYSNRIRTDQPSYSQDIMDISRI